ncbi:hypothetical protein DVH05_025867 [Phytophthora capsici]|nr:hypothetical protein DVH05_025867 [Phytophthora capsici]
MDDLPIIELPEHYQVDGERLGMALAHASAQANCIAEHQVEHQHRQSRYEEEQQRFVEQWVAAAREEAEARNNALVLAIQQTYDDPSTLELRVDARIQDILQQLQHGSQEQARAFAEVQIADQAALILLIEQRTHSAVLHIEQEINLRVEKRILDLRRDIADYVKDQFKLAIQHAEEHTRTLMNDELQDRRNMQRESITRSELRVAELVRGILQQHDSAMRVRQQQNSDDHDNRIEERLRQVVVVAKLRARTDSIPKRSGPICEINATAHVLWLSTTRDTENTPENCEISLCFVFNSVTAPISAGKLPPEGLGSVQWLILETSPESHAPVAEAPSVFDPGSTQISGTSQASIASSPIIPPLRVLSENPISIARGRLSKSPVLTRLLLDSTLLVRWRCWSGFFLARVNSARSWTSSRRTTQQQK